MAADVPAWPLAGRQGVVRHVLVPVAQATDRAAYQQQIGMLCPDTQSCFLNFYTNSTGAAVALPLPEAISREATAVFRRSEKRGADSFQWRCGLQTGAEPCF